MDCGRGSRSRRPCPGCASAAGRTWLVCRPYSVAFQLGQPRPDRHRVQVGQARRPEVTLAAGSGAAGCGRPPVLARRLTVVASQRAAQSVNVVRPSRGSLHWPRPRSVSTWARCRVAAVLVVQRSRGVAWRPSLVRYGTCQRARRRRRTLPNRRRLIRHPAGRRPRPGR